MNEYLAEMRNISKHFGGVKALNRVNFGIRYNEVVGLVGDNGAGKSTLIKILAGVYSSDEGEIYFRGNKVEIENPRAAKDLGIETVYQELALAPNIGAFQNVFLGREMYKPGVGKLFRVLDKKTMQKECHRLLKGLSIEIESVKMRVDNLSGGQRQSVAIAKSLYSKPQLLIMDEPTTAISVKERKRVLTLMQDLSKRGISVIFISHTLQEIFSVAHRVIILRKGVDVAHKNINETTIDEVIKLMVG
jgi:ABC-type sugar transport system ATPase subunit